MSEQPTTTPEPEQPEQPEPTPEPVPAPEPPTEADPDVDRNITAKIKVTGKSPTDGQTSLSFGPDYTDDRNKEWAKYTPYLSLSMTVLDSVAERFEVNQPFTLTFTPETDPTP